MTVLGVSSLRFLRWKTLYLLLLGLSINSLLTSVMSANQSDLVNSSSNTPAVVVSEHFKSQKLTSYISILEDKSAEMKIADIVLIKNKFKKISDTDFNYKFSKSNFWIKLSIEKNQSGNTSLYLQQKNPRFMNLELFTQKKDKTWMSKKAGWSFPAANREVFHNTLIFKIEANNPTNELFILLNSELIVDINLELWAQHSLNSKIQKENLEMGIIYGIILILMAYNLYYGIKSKDYNYIYLTMLILSVSLYHLNTKGLTAIYFWASSPGVLVKEMLITSFCITLFLYLFGSSYLRFKSTFPVINKALKIQVVFMFLLSLILIFDIGVAYLDKIVPLVRGLMLSVIATIIYGGIRCLRKGSKEARWFLIAGSIFIFTVSWIVLSRNGLISQQYHMNGKELWLASILTLVLFSFSIENKIKALELERKKQKKRADDLLEKNKKNLEKQNIHLEEEVRVRTKKYLEAKISAEEANEAKTIFLANISHELRTPLHGILSYSAMGQKRAGKFDATKAKKYFKNIEKSGKRLLTLISELLSFSKIESGKIELEIKNVNIEELIRDGVDDQIEAIKDKNMKVLINIKDQSAVVKGDGFKLSQVISNLLSNAIKFSSKESVVKITVNKSEKNKLKFVEVSVKDDGVGIPEKELKSIFSAFAQSSLHSKGSGGTGLGLSISQEIIHAHEGDIKAENNSNGGATLSFWLPIKELP